MKRKQKRRQWFVSGGAIVWIGVEVMARVIGFYIPARFRRIVKWVPPQQRGKVVPFRSTTARPTFERRGWFGGLAALRQPGTLYR
jgi:hypothetical protein